MSAWECPTGAFCAWESLTRACMRSNTLRWVPVTEAAAAMGPEARGRGIRRRAGSDLRTRTQSLTTAGPTASAWPQRRCRARGGAEQAALTCTRTTSIQMMCHTHTATCINSAPLGECVACLICLPPTTQLTCTKGKVNESSPHNNDSAHTPTKERSFAPLHQGFCWVGGVLLWNTGLMTGGCWCSSYTSQTDDRRFLNYVTWASPYLL